MTVFTYVTHSADGQEQRGTVEAEDLLAARTALRDMNLDVVEIHELPDSFTLVNDGSAGQVTGSDLTQHTAVEAGSMEAISGQYYPLADTLRLYAGWLLAWYFFLEAVGTYQQIRHLPWQVPYVDAVIESPAILGFSFAAFLFLLLTNVYRVFGKGKLFAAFLGLLGLALVFVFESSL